MTDGPSTRGVPGTYEWLVDEPMLHEPVLVVMLTGWIDASGAGAAAAEAFSKECETSPLVRFDDDAFIDYRARRPVMELRDGINTDLVWFARDRLPPDRFRAWKPRCNRIRVA